MRRMAKGMLAAIAVALAQPRAHAEQPISVPSDPVVAMAFAVLERHCARCHQDGRLTRPAAAANFRNVLHLDQLVLDPRYVRPGNPDASRVWTHMTRRLMPYDVFQQHTGGDGPTAEEILAVRDWIEKAEPLPTRAYAGKRRKRSNAIRTMRWTADDELMLRADKETYTRGNSITLTVRSRSDCGLTLISIDAKGRGTVIFPNDFEPAQRIVAGEELKVPRADAGYRLRLREAGTERIVALCNTATSGAVDGIRHDFERQRFTEIGDYRAFLARALAPEAEPRPQHVTETVRRGRRRIVRRRVVSPPEPRADPAKVLRTGIIVEVR
ncbi:MAG: DUF4384 domain-containing protein [Hyphomicrobiaceae bacterium]